MTGKSKRDYVDTFIRRAVREAIQEIYWKALDTGVEPTLRSVARDLELIIAWNCSGDSYRLAELEDIMDWKKPKEV